MRTFLALAFPLLAVGTADAGPPSYSSLAVMCTGGRVDVCLAVWSPDRPLPDRPVALRDALAAVFETAPDSIRVQQTPFNCNLMFEVPAGSLPDAGEWRIDLQPVLAALKEVGQTEVHVAVMLGGGPGSECSLPPAETTWGARWFRDQMATDDPNPQIVVTFTSSQPAVREPSDPALLVALLVAPLPILGWAWLVRRRAARAGNGPAEPLVASYWRFHQNHFLATVFLWLAAFSIADAGAFVAGWFPAATAGARLLRWFALYGLPPAAIALSAQAIARPALTKLQALGLPGVEMYRHSGSLHLLPHAAILCAVAGVAAFYETGQMQSALVLIFGGAAIYVIYVWTLRRMLVLTPNALSTGELHDRVAELARRFRVAVPLVSILSNERSELANAFAVPGRGVWLTENLVRNFSRREVDAIVAHELAHFRQFAVRRRQVQRGPTFWTFFIVFSVFFAAVAVVMQVDFYTGDAGLLATIDFMRWAPFGIGLLIVGGRLSVAASKRKNEYDADRAAVEQTGDPDALISALTRLHRLGGTPLDWSRLEEFFYSHPATTRRITALQRMPPLIGVEARDDRYPIPATVTDGSLVFSSEFRQTYMTRLTWTFYVIGTAVPILAALLAEVRAEPGLPQLAVLGGGALATMIAYLVTVRRLRNGAQVRLRLGLREKLRARDGDPEAAGGVFVNFAPGDVPKLHECFGQWDVGYLYLGDRLVYVGEQVRFAVPRDQVMDIRAGAGLPGWTRRAHVYVTWRDPTAGRAGTFRIWPGVVSRAGYRTDLCGLDERLQAWQAGKITGPSPAPYRDLCLPAFGDVHGESPKAVGKGYNFWYSLLFFELLAAGVCALLGLSFDPETVAGAWYVLAVLAAIILVNVLPYWLAREPEPPVVIPIECTS